MFILISSKLFQIPLAVSPSSRPSTSPATFLFPFPNLSSIAGFTPLLSQNSHNTLTKNIKHVLTWFTVCGLIRSLEELNANFNKLIRLPDSIGYELTNLRKLSVNSNKLISLPISITHLTSLRALDARLNCLMILPDDLENLINLEILNVSQNFQYLTALPSSIGLLMNLLELDISYNKITVLPESIGCMRRLRKLSAEGNPIVSPPIEVVEQSLQAVREYLSQKMNGRLVNASPKKKSWGFRKLVKYGTFNGRSRAWTREEREGLIMPEYRPIDILASNRFPGISPRSIFSPRTYFSR